MKTVFFDIETTGLDAKENRVVAVGARIDGKNHIFTDWDETQMLEDFSNFHLWGIKPWQIELGRGPKSVRMVTYNGNFFDFPFLQERFKKHSLPTLLLKRLQEHHIDVMEYVAIPNMKFPKLSEVAEVLNVKHDNSMNGRDVPAWFKKGEMDKIIAHLEDDLETLEGVYNGIRARGLEFVRDELKKRLMEKVAE